MRLTPVKHVVLINSETLPEDTDPATEFNYIDIGSVGSDGLIDGVVVMSFANAPSRARRVVRPGDVIVSTVRTYLRAVAAIGQQHAGYVCSTGFAVLRPTVRIDPRFLRYAVRAPGFVDEVVARSTGVSYPAITSTELGRIPISVPTLDAQREIADFLDGEFARIDDLRAELDALGRSLGKAEERLIDDLLPDGPLLRLGWLAEVRTGLTLGARYDGELVERPYLRVANVLADRIDLSDVKTVAVPASVASETELLAGDVLMTEGGDMDKLGRGAVWHGEIAGCLHQNHVFAVRPRPDLEPEYLALVTRSALARAYFESTAVRSTNLASTNSTKVRGFRFPAPSRSEQQTIVDEFADRSLVFGRAATEVRAFRKGLAEYRDALITEAVSGRLPVAA